ncbi:site-2 protease family protein [Clostridia bacterium OttesenSCG-928-F22]|nr:site-2 protease family protein [Clostridia bacterium OttesenSCG-928-F22]
MPGILIALTFHEYAHASVANRLGDPTAKNMGRLTLNPLKHIDPIGFLCLIFFKFGWARPVMVNPNNFRKPRRDDTLVSLAGPFMNLTIAFLSVGLFYVLFYLLKINNNIIYMMMINLIYMNVGLFVFNLLPVPPLDGYHVFKNALLGKVKPNTFWRIESMGPIILICLLFILRQTGVLSTVISFILNIINRFFILVFGLGTTII